MIDDNPQSRRYIEKIIHYRSNHELGIAVDAAAAIDSMVERRPDVILLDLFIPGMDGFEFFDHIRKHPATESIPIIIHTAVPLDAVTKLRLKRMRFEGFVQFPIDASDLKYRLRVALKRNEIHTKRWVPPKA